MNGVEIICLDLEGVLIPEIWINVAQRTGIEALRATTRDVGASPGHLHDTSPCV